MPAIALAGVVVLEGVGRTEFGAGDMGDDRLLEFFGSGRAKDALTTGDSTGTAGASRGIGGAL